MPGEFGSEDQKTYWPVSTQTTDTPVNTSNLDTSGTSNGGITPYRPANEGASSVDQPLNPFHAHISYITNKTFPGLIKQETLDKIGDSFSYGGQSNLLSKVNSPQGGEDGTVIKPDTTNGNSASILPDEKFKHEGINYVRRNGQLFRSENVIPGKLTELSPKDAAGIDKGRAGVTAKKEAANALESDIQDASSQTTGPNGALILTPNAQDFVDGFNKMPEGNNPYDGLSPLAQMGRFVGKYSPMWDEGRQAADIAQDITGKYFNNKPVGLHDWMNYLDHGGKAALEGIGAAGPISKGLKIFRGLK